jgi:hypothetical protein
LLKKGTIWRIGNGKSVRMWRDPWIPRGWTRRPIGKKRSCRLKWVSQLINEQSRTWKEDTVREYFREMDAQVILNIKLPSRPVDDLVAWHFEKKSVFTARSAYKLTRDLAEGDRGSCQSNSANQDGRPIWKSYWKLPIPHKILNFGWKVINKGLATQVNKKRCSIIPDSMCTICGREA